MLSVGSSSKNPQPPATQRVAGNLRLATWIARIAFAAVFAINVQCATGFVAQPGQFLGAYELAGASGEVAIRGVGIVFLMWNATYPAFIIAPRRFRVLGWVVLVQQVVGLIGESMLLVSLPAGHAMLASSLQRFIAFDGIGLAVMAASFAFLLVVERSLDR